MKIVFLCGSLEPGRDGVGDYVRRLAIELLQHSHQIAGIALNDKYILQEDTATQHKNEGSLLILRLPSIWSETKRFYRAKRWIDNLNPDWVSLQFVPYAFHPKGIPILLSKQFRKLSQDRRAHIMFHESWVGIDKGVNLKQRLTSALQKALIKNIFSASRPEVIHTHLPVYYARIKNLGHDVRELPLFSNIPLIGVSSSKKDITTFQVGIFSQADVSKSLVDFIIELEEQATRHRWLFKVLLLGGEATRMRSLRVALEAEATLRGKVCCTGFLEPQQLSEALQTCTLGLTTVPRHALGKSGSVAAFLSLGIPVAAPIIHPGYEATDIGFFHPELCSSIVLEPNIEYFKVAQASVQAAKGMIQVSSIAQIFLEDLARK
jgi:hypothetical protein